MIKRKMTKEYGKINFRERNQKRIQHAMICQAGLVSQVNTQFNMSCIIRDTLQGFDCRKVLKQKILEFHRKALDVQFKFKSQLIFNKARKDYLMHLFTTEIEAYRAELARKKDGKSIRLRKGLDNINVELMSKLLG